MTQETWSIQETRVAARNKGSWSSSSLNVTQAAGHKERWRESNKSCIHNDAGSHCKTCKMCNDSIKAIKWCHIKKKKNSPVILLFIYKSRDYSINQHLCRTLVIIWIVNPNSAIPCNVIIACCLWCNWKSYNFTIFFVCTKRQNKISRKRPRRLHEL